MIQKTLLVAHATDFNTITFLPSKQEDSAERPKNNFHFVETNAELKDQLEEILQEEANIDLIHDISLKVSEQGVNYLLIRFSLAQEGNLTQPIAA